MDTLKSLAIIALLGVILYGVYTVASKPDQPLPPEIAAQASAVDALPVIETGRPEPRVNSSAPLLSPPKMMPGNPLQTESASLPAPPAPFPASPPRTAPEETRQDQLVQPAANVEPARETPAPPPLATPPAANVLRSAANPPATVIRESRPFPAPASPGVSQSASPSASESGTVIGASYSRSESPSANEIAASQSRVRLYAFRQAWKAAQDQVKEQRHREALLTLSAFYGDPVIPPQEHAALLEWLDSLAARVIYGTQHYLAPEYVVRRGESLYNVAEQYHVPYLLLKNINGVREPEMLLPGTRLKVVPGPFRAEVSLSRKELTLFVGGLYAGRFGCTSGRMPVAVGEYTVKEKNNRKPYHSGAGTLSPQDPRNPYGGIWIDLGNQVSLHGSSAEAYVDGNETSLSLAPRDAEDIYGILSVGSQVLVKE